MIRPVRSLGLALVALGSLGSLSCTSRVIDAWVSPDADGTRRPDKAAGSLFVTFGADIRAVYCIVELSNGREDATIEGVMHQQSVLQADGTSTTDRDIIVATISQIAPVGTQQRVALALTPKGANGQSDDKIPLSGGVYLCEFALHTEPVPPGQKAAVDKSIQFQITPTDCPPAQIQSGEECTFFAEGKVCNADGARSTNPGPEACTCSGGAWSCQ